MTSTMTESEEWLQAAANLKNYIRAGDTNAYRNLPETVVVLDLTHSNLIQRHIEMRFDKHQTLDDLRHKIYQTTGSPHGSQHLQLFANSNSNAQLLAEIPPTEAATIKLGYYSLAHGMRVHCIDTNPNSISSGGKLENTKLVTKYKISDDDYNQRKNTVRRWGQEKKAEDPSFTLAKHGQEHKQLVEAKRLHRSGQPLPKGFEVDVTTGTVVKSKRTTHNSATTDEDGEDIGPDSVEGMAVDMRCQVAPGGRRGTIQYVGEVPELKATDAAGQWVGIRFDEPVGKSNGTIGGTNYFDAMEKFGGFCRGKNVRVGDFPERDIFDELSDDEDDEL